MENQEEVILEQDGVEEPSIWLNLESLKKEKVKQI